MIASTYTDFGSVKVAYIFTYPRGADLLASFRPQEFGFSGPVFVYNYTSQSGRRIDPEETFSAPISGGYAYFIVTAIGSSGIGLLGDAGQFVSLGRQRIRQVVDAGGVLTLEIAFAQGEDTRSIYGYAPQAPDVVMRTGTAGATLYDPLTGLFRISISGQPGGSAILDLQAQ